MLKPRVKSVFAPLPPQLGADQQVWRLLRLMDGTRTTDQICAAMRDAATRDAAVRDAAVRDAAVRSNGPHWTDEDIRAVLEQLIGAGYVEDAAASSPTVDLEELERYRRDVELFGFFNHPPLSGQDHRDRLGESRVTVFGVGGLGSYAALALARAGVGDLLLVDEAEVTPDCLPRQALYTEADLGRPRAEAAAARLSRLHPSLAVGAVRMPDGVRGRDLLLCAENYGAVNRAALAEGVPWLRGADDGLVAGMFLHIPGQTACFECDRRSAAAPMTLPGDGQNPCTAPVSGLIGNMAALEAVKLLSGALEPATLGRKLIFDLRTMNIRFQEGVRQPDCPACRGGG